MGPPSRFHQEGTLTFHRRENGMLHRKYGFMQATRWMLGGLYDTGKAEIERRLVKKTA